MKENKEMMEELELRLIYLSCINKEIHKCISSGLHVLLNIDVPNNISSLLLPKNLDIVDLLFINFSTSFPSTGAPLFDVCSALNRAMVSAGVIGSISFPNRIPSISEKGIFL
jgi:hypothetical protein